MSSEDLQSALDARVIELESRLTFQDDIITSLNDALVAQQARITELERSLELVINQLGGSDLPDEGADAEPPPHY